MKISRTRIGFRLSQHGVVISELRTSPGPTHSVFDVLAVLIEVLAPKGRIGLLGFAGGGMMAPLRGLESNSILDAVDLDSESHDLFCRHCPDWTRFVRWHHAEAGAWLRGQTEKFGLLIDDLSVPADGTVSKPELSWLDLPALIGRQLQPGGKAVFNLMSPPGGRWKAGVTHVTEGLGAVRVIEFDDYENRIVVAGEELPSAQELGVQVRLALRRIGSRQATRIRVLTPS